MGDSADRKREAADSFGAVADAYLGSETHGGGADLDRIAAWCADAASALDIATGAGHTAGAVARAGVPFVLATDASPAMVATAVDAYDGVIGVVGDAERLPFASASFDAVACRIAAHHFPDSEAFVAEVARVCRHGGTLAFEDNVAPADSTLGAFINRVEGLRDPTHVESHPTARWTAWFEAAGFDVEETLHLKTTLDFDWWTDTQSLTQDERREVEQLLLDAPRGASDLFEISVEDGHVSTFANLKGLIRATRIE